MPCEGCLSARESSYHTTVAFPYESPIIAREDSYVIPLRCREGLGEGFFT